MTINRYFTLTTSDITTLSKRFRVVEGGYKESYDKKQNIATTLDGGLDISEGAIYTTYAFIVKVYQQDPSGDTDYGTLGDLKTFYGYNNPNGTPSNIFIMVDHYGNTCSVMLVGPLDLSPATVMLEGTNAIYFVPITLMKVA